jgi:general secretion pathway protein A
MYYEYFHLNEHPFRLNTDSRFLYMSKEHAQAKAYLEYALMNEDNLLVLTGEIGSGKSLIADSVIQNLEEDILAVKIHQTLLSAIEFLQMLLLEFGIKSFHERKVELLDQISEFLVQKHKEGRRVLLIVDEAQNLEPHVLEELRFLSDMEYNHHKLLDVFLIGQPEFRKTLELPEMEQLRQRVHLRFHLDALGEDEIKDYIMHRIKVAGEQSDVEIEDDAVSLIFLYSGGRPRLINVLCDHALTCAFVEEKNVISKEVIETSIEELNWTPYGQAAADPVATDPGAEQNLLDCATDARIVVTKGSTLLVEHPVNKSRLTIGRHKNCDIILKDTRVSRQHAQLVMLGDEIYIHDLNSKNGTYAGIKRVDVYQLVDGDVIRIADFELKYFNPNEKSKHEVNAGNILHYPVSITHK